MTKQTQSPNSVLFTFFVRERFLNQPGKFEKYCKILRDMHSRKEGDHNNNPTDKLLELKNMFADDQDLLFLLNDFLPPSHHSQHKDKTTLINLGMDDDSQLKETIEFVNKVHKRFEKIDNGRVFIKFADIMGKYQKEKLTVHQVDRLLDDLFQNDPDLYVEFTRYTVEAYKQTQQQGFVNPPPAETFNFTSPDNKKREETEQEKEEAKKEKALEEKLGIWEDYKYEIDRLYHRIESTLRKLDRVVEQLKQVERDCVNVEEFKNQDFECIELLYGESDGEYMVELLLNDPSVNAEILQARIAKKLEEFRDWRGQMDMVWGGILEDARRGKDCTRYDKFLEKVKAIAC